jgi:flagellar biogenesis protein FliO
MPRKLSVFGLLLLLVASPGAAAEQHFFTESFRKQATANLAPRGAADSQPASLPAETQPAKRGSPSLVRPATYQTPDRPAQSVQAAVYSSASESPEPASPPVDASSPNDAEPEAAPSAEAGLAETPSEPVSGSVRSPGFPRLASPGRTSKQKAQPASAGAAGARSIVTVISSLAFVLGLFSMVAWLIRRAAPGANAVLPSDVFEVLGRASIAKGQQVQLLRCGDKLLLVCTTPEGTETLTEIENPDEVTRLAGLCKSAQSGSATAAFRQALQQFAGRSAEPEFAVRSADSLLPGGREDLHG